MTLFSFHVIRSSYIFRLFRVFRCYQCFLTCLACVGLSSRAMAMTVNDSVVPPRYSYEVKVNPGTVLATDKYVRKWLKTKRTWALAAELHYTPQPQDCDAFAKDYNYPTFSLGLRYSFNHGTAMHREKDPDWGLFEPVDYDTPLGNVVTVYGTFSRPLYRSKHWELAYFLGCGIGYSHLVYNTTDQIDNELIGSHLNIYFTAGASATYRINKNWGIKGGIDFSHHSNGALYRPNKGTNYFGPFIGIVYYPTNTSLTSPNPSCRRGIQQDCVLPLQGESEGVTTLNSQPQTTKDTNDTNHHLAQRDPKLSTLDPRPKHWFAEFSLGIGAKTLLEDWQKTHFQTEPGAPDYCTDRFKVYAAYSLQADVLYRYARRWASGVGIDLFYGSYSNHVKAMDEADGYQDKHSPWSVGIAAKHEVFYGNLSVRMGIGYYLFRQMGHSAQLIEKPYYERIGVHYAFPKLNNLSIGFNVNAHLTKADFTEIQISYPIRLK